MSSTDLSAPAAGAASWTHLTLDRRSAAYWRVTVDHRPISTITATTIAEVAVVDPLGAHEQRDGV